MRSGSRHEAAPLNGISHFIEHTLFKGTRNRTSREIAVESDAIGGHVDAFTSRDAAELAKLLPNAPANKAAQE